MKLRTVLLNLSLFIPLFSWSQGTGCSNAIPVILDGVYRYYATSSSTGSNVICNGTATEPITFFSFTTNASGENVLLDITAPNNQPCEVAMYGSCSGGNPHGLEVPSSMCFFDGTGLWAPSETMVLSRNTTYYLRIQTTISGTITISGKNYTPPNDDCFGAFSVDDTPISDNNACAHGGPGVTPIELCAFSLENTVFYQYHVAITGVSIININSIACDNGAANNSNGFQIGFFTGTCSSLIPLSCSSGSGNFVQATTPVLAAGTNVYVAVDGSSGSNCSYLLSAFNAQPLPARLNNFSAWKTSSSNILKWTTKQELNNLYFDIQRSPDGIQFTDIGRKAGEMNSNTEKNYSFEDKNPLVKSFYRLAQTDIGGRKRFSNIISVSREDLPEIKFEFANPVSDMGTMAIQTNFTGKVDLVITNISGWVIYQGSMNCDKGLTAIHRNFGSVPDGRYVITARYNDTRFTKSFIKISSGK